MLTRVLGQASACDSADIHCHSSLASGVYEDPLSKFWPSSPLPGAVFIPERSRGTPGHSGHGRRDPFPIPCAKAWADDVGLTGLVATICLDVCSMCLVALNYCLNDGVKQGVPSPSPFGCSPATAQASAQRHMGLDVVQFLSRLDIALGATFPLRKQRVKV